MQDTLQNVEEWSRSLTEWAASLGRGVVQVATDVGEGAANFAALVAGEQPSDTQQGDPNAILATIRHMESRNQYDAQNPTSSASGAYQFIDKTWQSLTKKYNVGTEYPQAKLAPPPIQDLVAGKYAKEILTRANGDVTKVPVVWYTGNVRGISKAATPEQVAAYQQKWLAVYSGKAAMAAPAPTTAAPGTGVTSPAAYGSSEYFTAKSAGSEIPKNDIVALGKYLQGQGISVSEQSQFGGVRFKHGENSRHYRDMAIDLNIVAGDDSKNPAAAAKFDALMPQLEAAGYSVLWRTHNHYDHMHVSVGPREGKSDMAASKVAAAPVNATAAPVNNGQALTPPPPKKAPPAAQPSLMSAGLPKSAAPSKISGSPNYSASSNPFRDPKFKAVQQR